MRFPRCGGGARNGASVSISSRSSGHSRATCWIVSALGKATIPEKDRQNPSASARRASSKAAREAVDHSAGLAGALLLEDGRGLVVGLARVDDDRQRDLAREPELAPKHLPLHLARRVVVVKVQPDLAHRHDASVARQPPKLVPGGVRRDARLVRVNAGGRRQAVARGDIERAPMAPRLVDPADDQHLGEPGRLRAGHHLVPIGVKSAMSTWQWESISRTSVSSGCIRSTPILPSIYEVATGMRRDRSGRRPSSALRGRRSIGLDRVSIDSHIQDMRRKQDGSRKSDIAEAILKIAGREGIGALTMERLARELGAPPARSFATSPRARPC